MEHSTVKILVVDDTPANLEILSEYLAPVGYEVAVAISGERALRRLQTYQPHLILLDVQMSGIDGFETCRRIKAHSEWKNIPIIFITALNDSSNITKGFSLGAVDYIAKPFQEAELLARIATHLRLQQMNQTLENIVAERTQALELALTQLKESQLQTVHSEKMATLGNLVTGVAHEINNPLGFLNGSIEHTRAYVENLLAHLKIYQQHQPPTEPVRASADEVELEFLLDDFPKLLNSMHNAIDRINEISASLRIFSRADTECKVSANLHEGIDSALLILKYRLKADENRPEIAVVRDYGKLPEIECFSGQLNQVFMNILANAIDMFDEMAQQTTFEALKNSPQQITIKSAVLADQNIVEICIADNGKGMPEDVKSKVFNHLFTTKDVGKGTGLGMAIAYQIVTETHSGQLFVESELGQGSEFIVRLPLSDSQN